MPEKQRHGCLTAWLIFMMIFNFAGGAGYLYITNQFKLNHVVVSGIPPWIWPTLAAVCFSNFFCAVALFHWKKWGFYGFCLSCLIVAAMYVFLEAEPRDLVMPWISMVSLYAVLHIGKQNKGWPQLESAADAENMSMPKKAKRKFLFSIVGMVAVFAIVGIGYYFWMLPDLPLHP